MDGQGSLKEDLNTSASPTSHVYRDEQKQKTAHLAKGKTLHNSSNYS